jgi:hypothetical protein
MQFGYFAGSIAGGAALAVGGYSGVGAAMATLFLGAATTLGLRRASRGASTGAAPAPATPQPALHGARG